MSVSISWYKKNWDFFLTIDISFSHCEKFYQEVSNRKGSCSSAPDCVKSGIETISGMKCARGMLYHCMSDSEGDIINQPCACNVGSGDEVSCTKRWIGLALLSLCVPCLCLYPPLKACHMIGIQCGVCGAKHKPQIWQPIKVYHHPGGMVPSRQHQKPKQQARVHFQQPTYKHQHLPSLYADHRSFYISNLQSTTITSQPGINNCNYYWWDHEKINSQW